MTDIQLADRLFVPWERLGWEYVPPPPPSPSPEVNRMPVWVEPPSPDFKARPKPKGPNPAGAALAPLFGCGTLIGGFMLIGVVAAYGFGPINIAIDVFIALVVLGAIVPPLQRRAKLARFRRERDAAFVSYQAALAAWRDRVARHDNAERQRYAAALRWYPLRSWSGPDRIDVFGGTGDGWASLLATLGCSLLTGGAGILVLDFTEQQVAGGLAAFARRRGCPVTSLELPADWSRWHPVAGLGGDELAELLADAVHTMRAAAGTAGTVDGRALDAELLAAVITRLDQPWTFGRIAAGVQVLRRMHSHTANGLLSPAEVDRLTAAIDTVGSMDRVRSELQFLASVLELLAHDEPDTTDIPPGPPELWTAAGLTVVATGGSHQRRKDALDRVVFHRVVRALRDRRARGDSDVVVVAGADHLGRDGLEELTRQAERTGVRLVLLLERLRSDLHDLLGGRGSTTLLMRLGNAREAATAAEFVGRGHKFVLSQLTQQVGATFTEGIAHSYGISEGTSTTQSANVSGSSISVPVPDAGSLSIPWMSVGNSSSATQSRTETWQDTVNTSVAESVTAGRTVSRVYEFSVEPTTVQSLPATAFVLVEPGPKGRRVVLGDCNPGITLLDRVAAEPRTP